MTDKKMISLILGCMCILLSAGIAIQVRTIGGIGTSTGSNSTENQLRDAILKTKENYDNLYEALEKAEAKLETERTNATQNNSELTDLENNIKEANKQLGLTEVTGEGVIVTLNDSTVPLTGSTLLSDPNDYLIHYEDIISIINELKNAGAEAISINGQRIVANSVIKCDGTVIKVNGQKIGTPFVISAIGMQETLAQVNRYYGYLWKMKNEWNLDVSFERTKNPITIPKYTGTIKFNYAQSQ